MDLIVHGGRPLRGEAEVPADKSITHRALMLSALASGRSSVRARSAGEDNHRSAVAMQSMGARVFRQQDGWLVEGVGRTGLTTPQSAIECGNSGTTMRLLVGLLAGAQVEATLVGDESLSSRPMGRVLKPLRELGASVVSTFEDGREYPPLIVHAEQLRGATVTTEVASAQVKSALLLAGLSAGVEVIVVEAIPTRDHTERMLRAYGADIRTEIVEDGRRIRLDPPLTLWARDIDVPGDFSSAAFLLSAALLTPGSEITLRNVGLNAGRTGFLEILEDLGAACEANGWREVGGEPSGDVHARYGELRPRLGDDEVIDVGGADIPQLIDELVVLAAVASQANARVEVYDAHELRVKESDRIDEIIRLLDAFGVEATPRIDGFIVEGPQKLRPAEVDVSSDHRVALTGAVLALASEGRSVLRGFEIAAVSYATFVDDLLRLGASIEVKP